MKATKVLLLGGLKVDERQRSVAAADRITAAWLVQEGGALPLGGCVLFAELEDGPDAPKEQLVRVSVEGPPGLLVLMNGAVPFAAADAGRRTATLVLDLDGVGLKQPGTYVFRVFAGNDECGSVRLDVGVAEGTVRARFGVPAEGQLPFTLFDAAGAFGGYVTGELRQQDGTAVLSLPAGYERLARAEGFSAAVERVLDRTALGEEATSAFEVEFQLPPSGAREQA
jgi:hypothetical protein